MSDTAQLSAVQQEVLAYIEEHKITDRLNKAVNDVCKARTADPFGFLVRILTLQAMDRS